MNIIEIQPLSNGAHRNQNGAHVLLNGWAIIPDDMDIPKTFPFVSITTEEIGGVEIVTKMTAGTVPAPGPEPEIEPTELEQLRADVDFLAAMTAIEL